MKKLFIAGYSLAFGGIEKSLIQLLKNIDPNVYEVTLLLQKKEGAYLKEVPSFVQIEEYKVSHFPIKIFRKIYNRMHFLYYTFKNKQKYDHAICYVPYDIPSSKIVLKVGKKCTYWIHSNYTYIYKEENTLRNFFDTRGITLFDQIVFVSNESRNDLLPFYPTIEKKSVSVNNLFDFDDMLKKAEEEISLPLIHLLFVGRLEEESKGIFRLLAIMKEFLEEGKSFHLSIIGDGKDKKKYEQYKKEHHLSNVTFLGSKMNPYPYMKKADLLVLPSYYEGFPLVTIEALALGTKVLTTICVSTFHFSLKDYVFLCENDKNDIKNGIIKAVESKPKKKFDFVKFQNENKRVTFQILDGDIDEI